MNDHLGTWDRDEGDVFFRLDLWDTGRTGEYGKTELRYALAIIPDEPIDARPIVFDGEEFYPSPGLAIDSNETAGGLLGFFAAYGESIRYSGDDADVSEFTARQRDALADHYEALGLWAMELEETSSDSEILDEIGGSW